MNRCARLNVYPSQPLWTGWTLPCVRDCGGLVSARPCKVVLCLASYLCLAYGGGNQEREAPEGLEHEHPIPTKPSTQHSSCKAGRQQVAGRWYPWHACCPFWGHDGAQCCGLGQPKSPQWTSSLRTSLPPPHGACVRGTQVAQLSRGADYSQGAVEKTLEFTSPGPCLTPSQWGQGPAGLWAQVGGCWAASCLRKVRG